jgi:hypothetical protein
VVRFDRTIPPGGEGIIEVEFSAKSCRISARKTFIVKTNDPGNSSIYLTLKGHPALQ